MCSSVLFELFLSDTTLLQKFVGTLIQQIQQATKCTGATGSDLYCYISVSVMASFKILVSVPLTERSSTFISDVSYSYCLTSPLKRIIVEH